MPRLSQRCGFPSSDPDKINYPQGETLDLIDYFYEFDPNSRITMDPSN